MVKKRRATTTIILLTLAYTFFNLPYVVLTFIYSYGLYSGVQIFRNSPLTPENWILLDNLTFTHTVNLNSMVNALIYLLRITELNTFGMSILRRSSVALRRGSSRAVTLLSELQQQQDRFE